MAFIKAHLISLVSGVAALGFIALAVLGMMSDSVVNKMREQARVANQMLSLRTNPKNQECIAAEEVRGQRFKQEYDETLAVAEQINARQPLQEGVFPVPERPAVAYDFRDKYKEEIRKLPGGRLTSGDLPSAAEIQESAEDIAALEELLAQERDYGETAPAVTLGRERPVATPSTPVGTPEYTIAGMGPRPSIAGRPGPVGLGTGAGSTLSLGDPRKDPRARAAITKARDIRCYVSAQPDAAMPTFHVSPIWDPAVVPQADEMWYAQVGLWVQQDVVAAVAELNDEAARRLSAEQANVENMPVKRIQSIRLLGYWTAAGAVQFPIFGRSGTGVPVPSGDSLTGRRCDQRFDVIRFRVVAVVDQRDILPLIDSITRQNFYQLTGAQYEAVKLSDADYREGYLYGAAPVVRVTLDFEGYMARNVYEKYFPAEVRTALGIADQNGKKKDREP